MYRMAHYLLPTAKEEPAGAEIPSHRLMLRAGFIRQLGAGLYSHLPLMWRAVQKAQQIVREEQNRIGAQELFMPGLTPAELWEESGRWSAFGDDMFRLKDRKAGDYALAPTHEEIVADLARAYLHSYKQLPQQWYQFQTKFRDEPRPRSGVIRSRQFIMKDAYSLDADAAGLDAAYNLQREAYQRAFNRCGVQYTIVGASSGLMGGSGSEEFMVVTPSGEDTIAFCPETGYAANVEVATGVLPESQRTKSPAAGQIVPEAEEVHTPGLKTIEEVAAFLKLEPRDLLKSMLYMLTPEGAAPTPLLAVVRGDHTVNEERLTKVLQVPFRAAHEAEVIALCGCPPGFISPVGVKGPVRILIDSDVNEAAPYVAGANKTDYHLRNVVTGRDFPAGAEQVPIRLVAAGDLTSDGRGVLQVNRAIELGHIFKLGTRYSDRMGATYLDQSGKAQPIVMGSYGIGLERIVACAIEQHHDQSGIVLPLPIAPFAVLILALDPDNDEVMESAATLASQLEGNGWDVLLDDRAERPGVKFADADLIGIPFQVILGARGLAKGEVEVKRRRDMERMSFPKAQAAQQLLGILAEEMARYPAER